jgi:hypothetical protein
MTRKEAKVARTAVCNPGKACRSSEAPWAVVSEPEALSLTDLRIFRRITFHSALRSCR